MKIQHFFDKNTFTLSYVLFDETTKDALVIDSVLDYEPHSGTVSSESSESIIKYLKENNLKLHYILETHAHADHLSGSQLIKNEFPSALIGIGKGIKEVQKVFAPLFGISAENDGFDKLFADGETIKAGSLEFKVLNTSGHTPACVSYKFQNSVFTGDALFMPDYGTGRCDFPGGSASELYEGIHKNLYILPDDVNVYVGHDYQPGGRELQFKTTIGDSKKDNIRINSNIMKDEFVQLRSERDSKLKAPKLLLPSLQVNIRAGKLPEKDESGKSFLKIPLTIK